MSSGIDAERRELERKAAMGDERAAQKLQVLKRRLDPIKVISVRIFGFPFEDFGATLQELGLRSLNILPEPGIRHARVRMKLYGAKDAAEMEAAARAALDGLGYNGQAWRATEWETVYAGWPNSPTEGEAVVDMELLESYEPGDNGPATEEG